MDNTSATKLDYKGKNIGYKSSSPRIKATFLGNKSISFKKHINIVTQKYSE